MAKVSNAFEGIQEPEEVSFPSARSRQHLSSFIHISWEIRTEFRNISKYSKTFKCQKFGGSPCGPSSRKQQILCNPASNDLKHGLSHRQTRLIASNCWLNQIDQERMPFISTVKKTKQSYMHAECEQFERNAYSLRIHWRSHTMYVAPHPSSYQSRVGQSPSMQGKPGYEEQKAEKFVLSANATHGMYCWDRETNRQTRVITRHCIITWGIMGLHGASWGMMQLVQLRGERIYRGASMLGCREIDS